MERVNATIFVIASFIVLNGAVSPNSLSAPISRHRAALFSDEMLLVMGEINF